jgi:hypothetical protein
MKRLIVREPSLPPDPQSTYTSRVKETLLSRQAAPSGVFSISSSIRCTSVSGETPPRPFDRADPRTSGTASGFQVAASSPQSWSMLTIVRQRTLLWR